MITEEKIKELAGSTRTLKFKKADFPCKIELCCSTEEFIENAVQTGLLLYSLEYYTPRPDLIAEYDFDKMSESSMDMSGAAEAKQMLEAYKRIMNEIDLNRPMKATLAFIRNGVLYTLVIKDDWLYDNSVVSKEIIEELNKIDLDFAAGMLTEVR